MVVQNSELSNSQRKLISQKQALEQILTSPNGKLLLSYLGDLCLSDLGIAKKDPYQYAYSEGRRSVLLTLLQLAHRRLDTMLNEMVVEQEEDY